MKREYSEAEIDVIRFPEKDVICTSGTPIGEGDEDD